MGIVNKLTAVLYGAGPDEAVVPVIMTVEGAARLGRLARRDGATDPAQIIARALVAYERLVELDEMGYLVYTRVDDGSERRLHLVRRGTAQPRP